MSNTIPTSEEDFLEVDGPVSGQNYCCVSFISPENTLKQKELFLFHKYMTQRCGEWDKKLGEVIEKASDDLKEKFQKEIQTDLHNQLRFTYEGFKSSYDDFIYKYGDELDKQYNDSCNFKTNVRGVKVRGVYDTYREAEIRAKVLQRRDRSFHVFVGQVGYWLPWDPNADKVANEEYLEEELNTLMKEYKENEVRKDMFYEEQKREKVQDAMRERIDHEKKQKELAASGESAENTEALQETQDNLEEEDPWLKSKLAGAPEADEATDADEANTDATDADEANTEASAEPEVKVV
jgi:hypothetical protein